MLRLPANAESLNDWAGKYFAGNQLNFPYWMAAYPAYPWDRPQDQHGYGVHQGNAGSV